jgi:L-arabinose isomerase
MNASKPKLWFLTGSQHLYGDDTLRQVAGQSEQVQQLLTASGRIPAEIRTVSG